MEKEAMRPLCEETVGRLNVFLESVKRIAGLEARCCCIEGEPWAGEIVGAGWGDERLLKVPPDLAGTLARMGIERLKRGQGVAAERVDANYVRPSDAELFWKG